MTRQQILISRSRVTPRRFVSGRWAAVFALITAFSLGSPANAKSGLSLAPVTIVPARGSCSTESQLAREILPREVELRLLTTLIELKRFIIQQREVRPVEADRFLVAQITDFELCRRNKYSTAKLKIRLIMKSADGLSTKVVESYAQSQSQKSERARDLVLNLAVNDLAKQIDNHIPRKVASKLPLKPLPRSEGQEVLIQLIPRQTPGLSQSRKVSGLKP